MNPKPIHSASFVSDESEESDLNPPTFPFVTQLYDEATEFEKILFRSGCVAPNKSCPMGTTGFVNLLSRDLTKCERAIFNRDAKICAATRPWPPPSTDDPQSLPFESDDEKNTSSGSSGLSDIEFPSIHRAPTHDNEQLDELEPEDIVDILVHEFGPLAANGEEKLLLETDGCLLHDVAVVVSTNHLIPFY
jgi:sterol 3beta-glucosyltransferase